MFKKGIIIFTSMAIAALVITSCGKETPGGPLGVNKIKLTYTPTATPDVSFCVRICQEQTPVSDVAVSVYSIDTGVTLTSKTATDGIAGFPVHNGGEWRVDVASFNGFDTRQAIVEPVGNSVCVLNYGIPWLEVELLSGSEMVPIAGETLQYKVTYHTKHPRLESISFSFGETLQVSPKNQVVRGNMDFKIYDIIIPKSFENYESDKKTLKFTIIGRPTEGDNTESAKRTLTKDWYMVVIAKYHFMAIYDYYGKGQYTSYYAGIEEANLSYSHNVNWNPPINYEVIAAASSGDAGEETPVLTNITVPSWTDFGNIVAAGRIPTNNGWDYASSHPDNNGWVKIRFYDQGDVDIVRTFSTTNGWGIACAYGDCVPVPLPPNPGSKKCGAIPPGSCFLGFTYLPSRVYRERKETITLQE